MNRRIWLLIAAIAVLAVPASTVVFAEGGVNPPVASLDQSATAAIATATPIRPVGLGEPTPSSPPVKRDPQASVVPYPPQPSPIPTDPARPGEPPPPPPAITPSVRPTPRPILPTPTIGIPKANNLASARAQLALEAPHVLQIVELVEKGDVAGLLQQLYFHRLVCAPRIEAQSYDACLAPGRTAASSDPASWIEKDVFPFSPGADGGEYQSRAALTELLTRVLGGNRHSFELLAKRDGNSYTAFFTVDTRVVYRQQERGITGLWFQIPAQPGPCPLVSTERPSEWVTYTTDAPEVLGLIHGDEMIRTWSEQSGNGYVAGHRYEILWISQEQLDIEAARQRRLDILNGVKR